jgi:pyridoxal phosphate enzyme (YggS family)
MLDYEEFARRTDDLRRRIAAACRNASRGAESVELLAVTKTLPAEAADFVARVGLRSVGENRVQEGVEKRSQAAAPAQALRWELIGHLQSNKAKLAAQHFDRVQSVDSEKLLTHLDRAAADAGKILPVLLQINAGNDPAKFGAEIVDAPRLLEVALSKTKLRVDGLMTIAPLGKNAGDTADFARLTFSNLRNLRDELAKRFGVDLRELSMGMTGDLEIAIAEGSTLVRVGTALFGSRESTKAIGTT